MNRYEMLNMFYSEVCSEEERLCDRIGNIEFITTTKYIDSVLKNGDKILEVGAGTGRYSLYYADKGYDVSAIEYVNHNVDILKSKITSNMSIYAEQGDALNLSRFDENTFDVTLVLGPMYHMFTMEDKKKVLEEAIREKKECENEFVFPLVHGIYLSSSSTVALIIKSPIPDIPPGWQTICLVFRVLFQKYKD